MMGDRDYRTFINAAIASISRELEHKVDPADASRIHVHEVTRCLRRSYYDRDSPVEETRRGFNDLLSGLLRKLGHGSSEQEYDIGGASLVGRADMVVDDAVMIFRPADGAPSVPDGADLLYLNACMWIHDKTDGVVVYITGDRQEASFSLTRDKKMFEETVRRARVLGDLLAKREKAPILEPSGECASCQYYERCYSKQRVGRQIRIADLVGLDKEKD